MPAVYPPRVLSTESPEYLMKRVKGLSTNVGDQVAMTPSHTPTVPLAMMRPTTHSYHPESSHERIVRLAVFDLSQGTPAIDVFMD